MPELVLWQSKGPDCALTGPVPSGVATWKKVIWVLLGKNEMAGFIKDAGGLKHIENLQMHQKKEIYQKAISILEKYFSVEDEEKDQVDIAP